MEQALSGIAFREADRLITSGDEPARSGDGVIPSAAALAEREMPLRRSPWDKDVSRCSRKAVDRVRASGDLVARSRAAAAGSGARLSEKATG
jgi:hypothetical protein